MRYLLKMSKYAKMQSRFISKIISWKLLLRKNKEIMIINFRKKLINKKIRIKSHYFYKINILCLN